MTDAITALRAQLTTLNELQLVEQREHAARVAELEADRDRLRDLVRGFLWMLDNDILWRNCTDDGAEGYTMRSLRFVLWIRNAVDAWQYGDADRAKETKP